jgi:hypothetical protein
MTALGRVIVSFIIVVFLILLWVFISNVGGL